MCELKFDFLFFSPLLLPKKKKLILIAKKKVTEFVNFIETQSASYRTNNIILTMGGDFTYMDAHVYYKNLDKLIR